MNRFMNGFIALLAVGSVIQPCLSQSNAPTLYTDPDTGIVFDTWTVAPTVTSGGLTFGMALPEDALTTDATEFIGYLSCSSFNNGTGGWCGLSLGGYMINRLLLMAYAQDDDVLTSFRFTSSYTMPSVYTGNATLTQISSTITDHEFTLLFRCEGCLAWDNDGVVGYTSTSAGALELGWAQAQESPANGACPDELSLMQHEANSVWDITLDENAVSAEYETWAELAINLVTGTC
ncbi:hypothetical protein BDW59DRAFT_145062 [Aspergillus cavernicola]|uniref:Cellobiose dehydrogenase-like cytochrome domain-containing protein n=1 Tax=Aspergillus cavernicola TaxID=176166 RepID=A0ABR4IG56_9EURO